MGALSLAASNSAAGAGGGSSCVAGSGSGAGVSSSGSASSGATGGVELAVSVSGDAGVAAGVPKPLTEASAASCGGRKRKAPQHLRKRGRAISGHHNPDGWPLRTRIMTTTS